MNFLFVCTFNKFRSLTAEKIFKNHPYHNVRSVGTSHKARRTVNKGDTNWADTIFVMEQEHKAMLEERFPTQISNKKLIVLDIPDIYPFMDDELIEILKHSVGDYFKIE